jgi:hypothetical protein
MPYIFNTYGGEEGCIRILWGKLWERDYLEEPALGKRIILKWILKNWGGAMNWNNLAQCEDG